MLDIEKPPFVFPCLVDGRPVDATERILVQYPFTGELIGSVPRLDATEPAGARLRW